MYSLIKLAKTFEAFLKQAAKDKLNRNQLNRQFQQTKKQHGSIKKNLDVLELNDSKLQGRLSQIRNEFANSRGKLEQMRQSLENLDLTGADCVSLYEDGSTGYFIGNKEYNAVRTEEGGISLIPMRVHRKKLRQEKQNSLPQNLEVEEISENEPEQDEESEESKKDENELRQYWWEN